MVIVDAIAACNALSKRHFYRKPYGCRVQDGDDEYRETQKGNGVQTIEAVHPRGVGKENGR
jgi:hypothetical protein